MNTATPTSPARGVLMGALSVRPHSGEPLLNELGMDVALAAIGMIAVQFVLSSRWHWVSRPFGLDAVLRFHRAMGTLAFLLLAAHPVLFAGEEDVATWWAKALWVALPVIAAGIYVEARFLRPARLRKRAYTVTNVITEAPGVWTVNLAPPAGTARYDYLPGQFQFLTFHRGPNLPTEEHHWTISSSPTEPDFVSSTIKNSGDFTSTIGETKVGDTATVQAPFGRFSYPLHEGPRDLVFAIATAALFRYGEGDDAGDHAAPSHQRDH